MRDVADFVWIDSWYYGRRSLLPGEQLNIHYSYQDPVSEVKLMVFEAVFNRGKELAYKTLTLRSQGNNSDH